MHQRSSETSSSWPGEDGVLQHLLHGVHEGWRHPPDPEPQVGQPVHSEENIKNGVAPVSVFPLFVRGYG